MSNPPIKSGDFQNLLIHNSCNGDCDKKSDQDEESFKKDFMFSTNNKIFSVKSMRLPTPEEFIQRFCHFPGTIKQNNNLKFLKTERYSELFKVVDIRVNADLLVNVLDNVTKYNIKENIHYSPFEPVKCIANVTSVGAIYSVLKLDTSKINILKLPCKRKATIELHNEELGSQTSNNVYGRTGIQLSRQILLVSIKFESIEFFQDLESFYENVIESVCPDILLNLYSKAFHKIPGRIRISMNTTLTKYHKAMIKKTHGKFLKTKKDLLWDKKANLNTHLCLWDTKCIIRILQSVYRKLFNYFKKLSTNMKNIFYDFIIQFLSSVSNTKKYSIDKARETSIDVFDDNYKGKMTALDWNLLELFSVRLLKILEKYLKDLSKLKTIRVILFVTFLLKSKIALPEKTVRILYWQVILEWFCRFECCFFRHLSQLEFNGLSNPRYIKKKEFRFRKLFEDLLKQNLVQREKLSYCMYKCVCDKVFTSYCQWLQHSKAFNSQETTDLVMRKLRKRKRDKKKTPHISSCRVFKYEILSSLCYFKRKM